MPNVQIEGRAAFGVSFSNAMLEVIVRILALVRMQKLYRGIRDVPHQEFEVRALPTHEALRYHFSFR